MPSDIRILLLADSHLGFDLPTRARVTRRRRGHDLLANYAAALEPALTGEVDLVVHAGDVFHRPRVAPGLAYQALGPLKRVAELGVPVFVVPGNHERSRLPHGRLVMHDGVHVFDRPRTFVVEIRGVTVAVSGFPFERRDVRTRFPELLDRCDWKGPRGALRLLCIHQCVEGATVGPGDFTFTRGADVIRGRDIAADFAAVLSGHIHRHQVLTTDLSGRPLAAPVLYPGSLERLSTAEIGETKGFMVVHIAGGENGGRVRWEFRPLPARPMMVRQLCVDGLSGAGLDAAVRALIAAAPRDAVLRIRLSGDIAGSDLTVVSAPRLRSLAPPSMNVEIQAGAGAFRVRRAATRRGATETAGTRPGTDVNLPLGL